VSFDGFDIRPVVIERGRGWPITAHLYLPERLSGRVPAVMWLHGHTFVGKSTPGDARVCRGLVRRGFVVLAPDFPEADERAGTGHRLWYPVLANMQMQGIMQQDYSAAFTYLAGLPFVDSDRIGVTGSSGGGNATVFFCALDGRPAAAAPSNAPCLFREHVNSATWASCHCEMPPSLIARGVEYHDMLAAIAPRPLRVFAAIRDASFPILGAREAAREASLAYRAFGGQDRCTIEEHYSVHALPLDYRRGMYGFFDQTLKAPGDLEGPGGEGDDIDMRDPRLRALPERPSRLRTVGDLYRERLRATRPRRVTPRQLNRLLGRTSGESRPICLLKREGRRWWNVLLQTADGALVPVVIRREGRGPVVLLTADGGKREAFGRIGERRGVTAALDWRGQGETAVEDEQEYQRHIHYLAMAGKPLPGGRVTDLIAVVRWLQQEGLAPTRVVALGPEASMVACLAVSVDRGVPRVELHGMLPSLKEAPRLVNRIPHSAWVPGLALVTDIPQLLAGLRDRAKVRQWLKPGEEAVREGWI
jgi:dienelactone hydrolase